jgi:pimeloyl-ACP methyl ester carboxylesterase
MKVNFAKKAVGGFNFEFARGISTQRVGAAEFGECMETLERVKDGSFESWTVEWAATADAVAGYAAAVAAAGDRLAAADAHLRASNYYRMAAFYVAHTDPRHYKLWKASRDHFLEMTKLSEKAIEYVEIEFEGSKLPAYFIPAEEEHRPTLIALGGFDSTMEEVYCWVGAVAADYGWNCLVFEGPGQWGALMENPGLVFRPDYEKPVASVVDYLYSRHDIDRDKIALIGYSAGGYFAPRAAAGEPRIKACIANTLVVDCGESARAGLKGLSNPRVIDTMFGLLQRFSPPARWGFQHAEWSLGITKPHDWIDFYAPFTLRGLEQNFQSPMLFLFGEDDIKDAAASSSAIVAGIPEFISSLPCDRYLHLFPRSQGASSHCQMGGLTYAHVVIFQWLDHIFNAGPLPASELGAPAQTVINLFGKYGGKLAATRTENLLRTATLI